MPDADVNKENSSPTVNQDPRRNFQIQALDILLPLIGRLRVIAAVSLTLALIAFLVSFFFKNNYEATAVIMPPKQEQSISSLLSGQLGSLAALGGGSSGVGAALNLKNPNEIWVGLLRSRTMTSHLVDQFNLKAIYHKKYEQDAIKELIKHTEIDIAKNNLISITVTAHDPVFSSQLANAYVDELHRLNTTLALTDSSQRRAFFEQQLAQEKELVAKAETDFQETQKRVGIIQPNGQVDLVARNIAAVRAQIIGESAQLNVLGSYATPDNPEYQRLQSQIAGLQKQLGLLENSDRPSTPGDIEIPTSKLPQSALEYTRKLRELKLQEDVYELLVKQFEAAKIDEARTAPLIQVVDNAVPSERKSGPHRLLIGLAIGALSFIIGVLWTSGEALIMVLKREPFIHSVLASIRSSLKGRG
ncbi:GumC family protein [Terracidiphilus gabretensis]|uniref:GumC family protein n=1 Tax=Terracidiphilus gabretensis TaxID=1577687 RepID=UPI0009E93FA4|nr:Wzz/FepE/Etk N-terminal domain-containing protein [Terracidiphilus gabretensis]